MVKFETNLWERFQLEITLPRNPPLDEIAQLLRIKDAVCLSDAEREKLDFGYVMVNSSRGPMESPVWDTRALDELAAEFAYEVELETADHDKLVNLIKARRSWPLDQRSLDLQAKVKGAQPDN